MNKQAWIGLAIFISLALVALLPSLLSKEEPYDIDKNTRLTREEIRKIDGKLSERINNRMKAKLKLERFKDSLLSIYPDSTTNKLMRVMRSYISLDSEISRQNREWDKRAKRLDTQWDKLSEAIDTAK